MTLTVNLRISCSFYLSAYPLEVSVNSNQPAGHYQKLRAEYRSYLRTNGTDLRVKALPYQGFKAPYDLNHKAHIEHKGKEKLFLVLFAVKIPELKVQRTALYRTRNYRINKNSGLFLSLSQVAVIDQFVQPACRILPDHQTLVISVRVNIRLA